MNNNLQKLDAVNEAQFSPKQYRNKKVNDYSIKKYFQNPDTKLLRAGWRILAFIAIFILITTLAMISVRTIMGSLQRLSILQFSILASTATLSVLIARRFLDKKSYASLGLQFNKNAILDIFSGFLNSALVMAAMFFALLWMNLIEFHGFTWWMDGTATESKMQLAALPIVIAVLYKLSIVAWWEELVFRGYFFQNLIAGIGLKWSIVITSLVFGFGHAINPDATFLSSLLITLITFQLIYAYLKTGQLWLPMGLHLGWNFFQSSIFGFAASGQVSPSLIAQSPTSPDWLSGGEFGVEGSVLILPVTVLSLLLIHYWVRVTRSPGQKVFEFVNEPASDIE